MVNVPYFLVKGETPHCKSAVTSLRMKGTHNVALHEGNYTQKRRAVWFGNESRGISAVMLVFKSRCMALSKV